MNAILLIAALTTQAFTLVKGWNALFFEVTPTENETPAQVFADERITKVLCYLPDAYDSTASYDSDGQIIEAPPVSFRQWIRDDVVLTDLATVCGGSVYLVYATDAGAEITLAGDPALPHFHWRKATQDGEGFASLAAPSIDAGEKKMSAQQFFGEGPWNGKFQEVYKFLGFRKVPVASPFPQAGGAVVSGTAYGFTSTRDCDWPGVVDVTGVGPKGITFGEDQTEVAFQIRNAGTTNRVISLTYKPAEGSGYRDVPLTEFDGTTTLEYEIAPGDSQMVVLHSDPTKRMEAGDLPYAGILEARDKTGGTKMRVRFPIRAEKVEQTKWPYGIYAGEFTLDAVGITNTATKAGGSVNGSLMLLIDKNSYPMLLQRIVVGVTNNTAVVCQDLNAIPESERSHFRRYSSVTMDPYNPKIENDPRIPIASKEAATFVWNIAYDSAANPNYHAWNPDHDGAMKNSSGNWIKLDSGDDFSRYQSATKPELFSVSNRVQLIFKDVGWNAAETLTGEIRWELYGLRANIGGPNSPILCTGSFTVKRICLKVKLDE